MSIEQPRFVYLNTEPGCWTVGHYSPAGEWHGASDHETAQAAADECHRLNGGSQPEQIVVSEKDVLVLVYKIKAHRQQMEVIREDCDQVHKKTGVKVVAIIGPDEVIIKRNAFQEDSIERECCGTLHGSPHRSTCSKGGAA